MECSLSHHFYRLGIVCGDQEETSSCNKELCLDIIDSCCFAGQICHSYLSIFLLERPRYKIDRIWKWTRYYLCHCDNLSLTWNSKYRWLHRHRNFLLLYVEIWSTLEFTFLSKDIRTVRFAKWSITFRNSPKWNRNSLQKTKKEIRI